MKFKNKTRMVYPAGLSLPAPIIEKIDAMRGDVPRSRYALRLIEIGFKQMEK